MLNTVMLDALQSRHTTLEGLTVQIVTWNVNAKLEEMVQLRRLFFPEEEKCFGSTPEIIVLGLQEMIELSTSNVIGGAMMGDGTERVDQWRNMLLQVPKSNLHVYSYHNPFLCVYLLYCITSIGVEREGQIFRSGDFQEHGGPVDHCVRASFVQAARVQNTGLVDRPRGGRRAGQ